MAALGMAAEIDVNTPVLVCFGVFILTVIFLLIHQNFLQNKGRAAGSREAFRPASAAGPACAGGAVRAGRAAGRNAGDCSGAGRLFASVAGPGDPPPGLRSSPTHSANTVQRFSDDDNLSIGTGDAWSASPDVVMRVTPSDGQPHYWRGRTYDVYTGDGWQSSLENDQKPIGADAGVARRRADRLRYTLPSASTPGDPPPWRAGYR